MELLEHGKYRIAIEGNIACGKSTLLRHLSKNPSVEVRYEPVEKWRNVEGDNLMARYYADIPRFAYLFQQNVMVTMMELHHTPQIKPLFVMERTAYSSRYCFVKTLYQRQLMEPVEFNCFDRLFHWLTSQNPPSLDLIVYMRASPETCLQRLYSRSREEEKAVSLSYMQALHECYEQWLGTPHNHVWHNNTPVLVLDSNVDLGSDAALHNKMVTQIWQKFETLEGPLKSYVKSEIENKRVSI